jgi:hypothetical protein
VSSYLESLNTDGTITFHVSQNGGPPVGRYLSVSGAQPIWINSGQGRMKWQAGTPFLLLGRSAFRIALGNLRIELAGPASTTLRLSSPGNIRHAIQESSNLTSWSTVANLTGSATLTNHINNTAPKFFRALMGD